MNSSVGCLNTTDVLDPLNLGHADISIWVVEGDVGSVPAFRKVGGRNIQVRRIGTAPPPPAPLPVLAFASASAFASEEQEQQEQQEKKDAERLASRLRTLKSLWQEGVLPELLYRRAASDELATWTRRGHRPL